MTPQGEGGGRVRPDPAPGGLPLGPFEGRGKMFGVFLLGQKKLPLFFWVPRGHPREDRGSPPPLSRGGVSPPPRSQPDPSLHRALKRILFPFPCLHQCVLHFCSSPSLLGSQPADAASPLLAQILDKLTALAEGWREVPTGAFLQAEGHPIRGGGGSSSAASRPDVQNKVFPKAEGTPHIGPLFTHQLWGGGF